MEDPEDLNPYSSPQEERRFVSELPVQKDTTLLVVFFVSVSLFLVCTLLLLVSPGLGVLGYLISLPGVLHGCIRLNRKQMLEGVMTWNTQFLQFIISFLIICPIIAASSVAFGITCYGVGMLLPVFKELFGNANGIQTLLFIGLPAGLLAGGIVLLLLFNATLPKKVQVPVEED